MAKLKMRNFVIPNEIIDSNNHQLVTPKDKRLVKFAVKGSGFSITRIYTYSYVYM